MSSITVDRIFIGFVKPIEPCIDGETARIRAWTTLPERAERFVAVETIDMQQYVRVGSREDALSSIANSLKRIADVIGTSEAKAFMKAVADDVDNIPF